MTKDYVDYEIEQADRLKCDHLNCKIQYDVDDVQVRLCGDCGETIIAIAINGVTTPRAIDEFIEIEKEISEKSDRLQWWLETYDITMPCGHKNRYLTGMGEIQYCTMCTSELAQSLCNDVDELPNDICDEDVNGNFVVVAPADLMEMVHRTANKLMGIVRGEE